MKKIISLALVFVVCAVLLAGCGNSSGTPGTGSQATVSDTTDTVENGTSDNSIVGTWEGGEVTLSAF